MKKSLMKLWGGALAIIISPFSAKAYTTMHDTQNPDIICHVSRYDDGCYWADITPYCRKNGANYECSSVGAGDLWWGQNCNIYGGSAKIALEEACHSLRRNYNTCTCMECTELVECQASPTTDDSCIAKYVDNRHNVTLYNVCDLNTYDGDYYLWSQLGSSTCNAGYYGEYHGGFDHCEECPEGGSSIMGANTTIKNCFKGNLAGSDSAGRWVIPGMCYYS